MGDSGTHLCGKVSPTSLWMECAVGIYLCGLAWQVCSLFCTAPTASL